MTSTVRTVTDDRGLAAARAGLLRAGLARGDLHDDPITQFHTWYDEWTSFQPYDPAAAVLATADTRGRPSARWVDVTQAGDGFVFYTNYQSRKATDLAVNAEASLCFGWLDLARQVQVSGQVVRLSAVDSDRRFAALPRPVQILAWATDQRAVVGRRQALEDRLAEARERFAGQEVPRPQRWGGFHLLPDTFEFWQGRATEVPDRFRYQREGPEAPWVVERLAP